MNTLILSMPLDGHQRATQSILKNTKGNIHIFTSAKYEYRILMTNPKTNILLYKDFDTEDIFENFEFCQYLRKMTNVGIHNRNYIMDIIRDNNINRIIYDDALLFPYFMFRKTPNVIAYYTNFIWSIGIFPSLKKAFEYNLISKNPIKNIYNLSIFGVNLLNINAFRGKSNQHIHLVFNDKQLQPHESQFKNVYYVGYASTQTLSISPFISWFIMKRPLIYISLGTLFKQDDKAWDLLIQSIAKHYGKSTKYNILITKGDIKKPPIHLPYNNIQCVSYTDQHNIIPHVDILITHGGMNAIYDAISHKKKIIIKPMNGDQYFISDFLQKNNMALVIKEQPWYDYIHLYTHTAETYKFKTIDVIDTPTHDILIKNVLNASI